ncbi:MAG: ADOP family duplicated permease [Longimicrobiales bacterium]
MTAPGGAGPGVWEARLSRRAEEALRGLPPVSRVTVARLLDELERDGPQAAEPADGSSPGTDGAGPVPVYQVRQADVAIRVVFRHEERVALVVSIRGVAPVAAADRVGWLADALGGLGADLRVALRGLRRAPGFALAVVLTLTLGLGGTTAIANLVHTVHRRALPFADAAELVRLRNVTRTTAGERRYNVSPRDVQAVREGNRVFDAVVAMSYGSLAVLDETGATRVAAISVSSGWARDLGLEPLLGRTFTPDEEAMGAEAGVVLLGHGTWERRFGADPRVLGRTLSTSDGAFEVVGVMPPRFAYPYEAEVWLPGRFDAGNWRDHDLNVVARLSDGVTPDAARADLARIYEGLRADAPGTTPDDGFHLASLREDFIRDEAEALDALGAAVVFLLFLACANVAGLLSIRLVERRREATLRAALGASRLRVARLAVVESMVLFLAGCAGGLAVAGALGGVSSALVPETLRTEVALGDVRLAPVVVVGAVAVALLAGLLTGGAAAYRASARNLGGVLREGGRSGPGRGTRRLQNALVASEVALALVLLVGAGVLFRSFQVQQAADLGYRTEGVLTLQVAVDGPRYETVESRLALIDALEARLGALPGVSAVGLTSVNPLCCGDWSAPVTAEGREPAPDEPPILVHHRYVTPGYFDVMGLRLLAGRAFGAVDRPDTEPVVVVDEALAERMWPGADPLGRRIGLQGGRGPMRTVIGVVPASHTTGDQREGWYLPMTQDPTGRSNEILHVMVDDRADGTAAAVRRAMADVDPALATFGLTTMDRLRQENLGSDRLGALLSGAFAGVGLILACLGLYGLLAYRVALQARELGTRMALGARRGQVVGLVLRRSAGLLAVGVVAGVGLSLAVNRMLVRMGSGVEMAPPGLLAALVALLGTAAAAASLIPAVRAARTDPARTLQEG